MGRGDRRARRWRLRGFVLPLVVVLVFAIMSVTSALVGTVTLLSRAARLENRRLVETITLESAVTETAAKLAAGADRPYAPAAELTQHLNGLAISTVLSPPEGKYDLNADPPTQVADGLAAARIAPELAGRVRSTLAGRPRGALTIRFANFATEAALSSAEEDCLRRIVTIGRWPSKRFPEGAFSTPSGTRSAGAALQAPRRALRPGEQIDLRSESSGADGRRRILWARIRMTGELEQPARAQDWLVLARAPGDSYACPVALPATAP